LSSVTLFEMLYFQALMCYMGMGYKPGRVDVRLIFFNLHWIILKL